MENLCQIEDGQRAGLESQLDRLLRSRIFVQAPRSRDFLQYVVRLALQHPEAKPKEYTIAVEVFGCNPNYDPSVDATVRVEAGRLRTRLSQYYALEGKDDPWVIDMPKGAYRATFLERPSPAVIIDAPSSAPTQPDPRPQPGIQPLPGIEPQPGIRPRTRSRSLVYAAAAALLVLLAASAYLLRQNRLARLARPTPAAGAPLVLSIEPFRNLTGDSRDSPTAELISGDLERQFADVPSLQIVRPGPSAPGPASHEDQKVILAGTLRRDSDQHTALALQLLRAGDRVILLDRQYLLEGPDLRAVQADIFNDVARVLHVEPESNLAGGVTAHPVSSANLHLYDQARQAIDIGSPEGLQTAIHLLESAVRNDPGFARAWSGIAEAHVLLALYFAPPRDHMPPARTAAERALALDPSLQDAHGTLGVVHLFYDWDYRAARADVSTAAAEDTAIHRLACFSHLLERTGNPRHGEEEILRLLAFDPRSAALLGELGCIDYYRGDYSQAVAYYRKSLQNDARSPMAYWGLGKSLGGQGKYAESLSVLRAFKQANGFEPPVITAEIGYLEGRSRHPREARAAIAQLTQESRSVFVDPYLIALIHHGIGDENASYLYLSKAFDVRSTFLISLTTEPKWQNAKGDPRFTALLARMSSQLDKLSPA